MYTSLFLYLYLSHLFSSPCSSEPSANALNHPVRPPARDLWRLVSLNLNNLNNPTIKLIERSTAAMPMATSQQLLSSPLGSFLCC